MLRAEALLLFALSLTLYFWLGGSWLLFLVLFLAPDLSMIGYTAGPRVGAMMYNLFHSYALPACLTIVALLASLPLALFIALVWFAHIAMDRGIGYGLKFASGFKDTHLGRLS